MGEIKKKLKFFFTIGFISYPFLYFQSVQKSVNDSLFSEKLERPSSFKRLFVPTLEKHKNIRRKHGIGHGFGAGLLDLNNDHKIDIFLGSNSPQIGACLYLNTSKLGQISFEPWEPFCQEHKDDSLFFATGISLGAFDTSFGNQNRNQAIILLGDSKVLLQSLKNFPLNSSPTNLLDALTEDHPLKNCSPQSVLVEDLNYDSYLDIIISCNPKKMIIMEPVMSQCGFMVYSNFGKLVFLQEKDKSFSLSSLEKCNLEIESGFTLAMLRVDINQDGLRDLVLANDTFSNETKRNPSLSSGGVLLGTLPQSEGKKSELIPFSEDESKWGSFMGLAELRNTTSGLGLLISDWGPNRFIFYNSQQSKFEDFATKHQIDFGRTENNLLAFSWSPLAFDFNNDDRQDVFLTVGMVPSLDHNGWEVHYDRLFLQTPKGFFVDFSQELDLYNLSSRGLNEVRSYASRGGKLVDFDLDGNLEVIVTGLEGPPKIYQEQHSSRKRCTITPLSRYVATWGSQYSFRRLKSLDWMPITNQGAMSFGGPPSLVVPSPIGEIKFPSGAVVPFVCKNSERSSKELLEPKWLEIERSLDKTKILIDQSELGEKIKPLVAIHSCLSGKNLSFSKVSSHHYEITKASQSEHGKIMLKFGTRWVEQCL